MQSQHIGDCDKNCLPNIIEVLEDIQRRQMANVLVQTANSDGDSYRENQSFSDVEQHTQAMHLFNFWNLESESQLLKKSLFRQTVLRNRMTNVFRGIKHELHNSLRVTRRWARVDQTCWQALITSAAAINSHQSAVKAATKGGGEKC